MRFRKNDTITLNETETIVVKDFLGDGGQGEVYLVEYNGGKYALKAYKNEESSDFRYNLKNNIERGAPSEDFLWPKLLLDFDDGKIGYLMDLRPKNFVSFVSYLTGTNKFKSRQVMLKWCIDLCIAFKKLHEMGYSYQDLNDGSFFLDPDTGDLLICDNDNVTADKRNLGILGKMRYMAPEIVRGDKNAKGEQQMPDVHSDRFSLAIILFMALCLGNPFEGERLKEYDIVDEQAEYEMFGSKPVFVYHKTDKSNRPIRGYHSSVLRRWAYIPLYVKEAFHRTFVDGLTDRENERTTELEWLKLLTKYRDELITCPHCGYEYIVGYSEKKKYDVCPLCGKETKEICSLHVGRNVVSLELGKKIYISHVDKYSSAYNTAVGIVVANKNNPSLWGIKLALNSPVEIKDADGNVKQIAGNGVIPIVRNLKIKFNENTIGEIR